jgi:outer membrane protein assembly factor BamB
MSYRRCCLIFALIIPITAAADDWTQWRGPGGNGVTEGRIGAKKLKPLWSTDVGIGYAAPSISNGRVFILGFKNGRDTVRALDAKTGAELWTYSYAAKNFNTQNIGGTAPTPSISQNKVITLSRDGQLHCFEEKTGALLWNKNIARILASKPPAFGFSGSPIINGDNIYIDVGVLAAFDLDSGAVKWRTKDYGVSYSSPAPFQFNKTGFIATFPASGLVIVDQERGRQVAQFEFKHKWPNVHAATPLVSADGRQIFLSSGYKLGCKLFRFDGKEVKELWGGQMMRNEMASSIFTKGMIVGFDNAVLKAIDRRTGKALWSQRGLGKGSLIQVGDEFVVLSAKGELVVAPVQRSQFKPRFRQPGIQGQGCWSAPVWAHGMLLLRDPKGKMLCLGNSPSARVKKKKRFF